MIVYKKGGKVNKKFKILLYIVIIGLGYGVGNLIGYYAGEQLSSQEAPNIYLIIVTLLFGIILQIIIHEAGHLFFGLLSGYKFISFKAFNFAIVKDEENRIKFKIIQGTKGTAGQCLMEPPKLENGTFPYKLYLAGGVLFNIIFSLLGWIIAPSVYMLVFTLIGLVFAITNAIPIGFNDGMSFKLCLRSEINRYAIHLSLVSAAYATYGKSYVVEHPEVLEKIKNLKVKEATHITDYLKFLEIEYNQDKFELKKVYDGLLKLYLENPDLILPYKIEVMRSLVMFASLFEPESEIIEKLIKDKHVSARLKAKEPQNKTILAVYEWRVKNNSQKALVILEDGRKILHRSPHLYAKIIDEKYINYIESLITSEMEQKI